jgi:hypothetical protein
MPVIVKVQVHAARNLPVMDLASKLADAYVELTVAKQVPRRTEVVRKTLNPIFEPRTSTFRFEIAVDADACLEPLVFTVLDKDFIQDDSIGQCIVSLEPLLAEVALASSSRTFQGWLPLYDTLQGIRGELSVTVRVSYFGNLIDAVGPLSSFPSAAAPVAFYSICSLDTVLFPQQVLLGFVEELIVESDPAYTMADTFRTSRLSNEHRQLVLHRLAYRLRASISNKVRRAGGNAVLGFQLHYDIEGDSGIVGRAYGTCVRLLPPPEPPVPGSLAASKVSQSLGTPHALHIQRVSSDLEVDEGAERNQDNTNAVGSRHAPLGSKFAFFAATSRSLGGTSGGGGAAAGDAADDGVTPAASELRGPRTRSEHRYAESRAGTTVRLTLADAIPSTASLLRTTFQQHNLVHKVVKSEDVQLFSVTKAPPWVRIHIGGLVAVRSVKFLGRLQAKAYDTDTRDRWWADLRDELRAHARSLSCSQVRGKVAQCTSVQCTLAREFARTLVWLK